MSQLRIARLLVAASCLVPCPARAGTIDLDLPGALARARRVAPAAAAARGDIAIARAAVTGAAVTFVENPEVDAGLGPRFTPEEPIEVELRLSQNLELGRRGPRRRLARAGMVQTQAEADAAIRELDRDVTAAFLDALFAERSSDLAQHAEDVARRAAEAADRRRKAGEITDLDANLARSALGRARSAALAAQAERASAGGRLGALIGLAPDDVIVLRGDLKPAPLPDATTLQAGARPDVRALAAAGASARAEHDQAVASRRPQIALWAGYRREDADSIVLGGVQFTIPMWNRAQGDTAAALAKERRAAELHDATLHAAESEIAAGLAAYATSARAVSVFEAEVLPVLDDSERLLDKTIDAGQIAVDQYLIARQEILAGRREYLERLLALARAAATVRFAAGGAP